MGMELDDIKEQMAAQKLTIKQLADKLCVSYDALRQIMAGQRPLTAQLRRHIELTLGVKREEMVIHRVTLPDEVAERLVPHAEQLPAEVLAPVLEAIVHHALDELAGLGAQLEWTPEERRFLGLPPVQ
jgi:transcriptional regulator with XRE-family HTH domain